MKWKEKIEKQECFFQKVVNLKKQDNYVPLDQLIRYKNLYDND